MLRENASGDVADHVEPFGHFDPNPFAQVQKGDHSLLPVRLLAVRRPGNRRVTGIGSGR